MNTRIFEEHVVDIANIIANVLVALGWYLAVRGLCHWLYEKREEGYAKHTIAESRWRKLQPGQKIQIDHGDGSMQQVFVRSIGAPDQAGRRLLCVQDAFDKEQVVTHLFNRDGTFAKRNVFNE